VGWRSFARGPAAGPLETMFNAASLSFPPNERFFIDSVRAYADRITDPVLKAEVRGFVYQEAMHNKVHAGFNLAIFLKLLAIVTFWHSNLWRPFWRALIDVARHNPAALEVTILQMGLFLHFGQYAARMVRDLDKRIGALPSAPSGQTQVGDAAPRPDGRVKLAAAGRSGYLV